MAGIEATSVFAQPPRIEVHHRGTWYAGELLGWRFDSSGRCIARVRCVVDGLRHSAWKDLADLRLPGSAARGGSPAPVARPAPAPAPPAPVPSAPVPAAPVPPAPAVPSPPPVRWASIGRHENAAPAWAPTPPRARHRVMDDDTRPHALLVDRDLRPGVPRTVARTPVPRRPVDAG